MDFILQNQFYILLGILILGFAVIGKFFRDLSRKVDILFGGDADVGEDVKKNFIQRLAKTETKLAEFEPRLKLVEEISKVSVQKIGFLRFNPFSDTGGDNSFVLALLDRNNNGVLITSLYLREKMRLYAKKVEDGQTQQQLSVEEEKVLKEAIDSNF